MPRLEADACRQRFAGARRAVLGTRGPEGRVDLVPVTFAVLDDPVLGEVVIHAVDHKPKSTRRLQRLANLAHDPQASLLVDHYDDDWSALWWVRAEGRGRVVDDGDPAWREALAARYGAYREQSPVGPWVAMTVERWSGWSAR